MIGIILLIIINKNYGYTIIFHFEFFINHFINSKNEFINF